ncbi:hypothetical protein Fmac_007529 [Flemingia macrophylla]|uniref:WD repeat-containing protein 44 n=1 Tax=Flemingia macrophylla TaxID=520843 RepID=A0ABD1MUT6_9FABA
MGSFSEDEECRFFDARDDDVLSIADDEGVSKGFDYELWIQSPMSVRERRNTFRKRMGLGADLITLASENSLDVASIECEEVMDRVKVVEEEFCSTRSSLYSFHNENSPEGFDLVDNSPCQEGNLESNVDQEGLLHRVTSEGRDLGSDRLVVEQKPKDVENDSRHSDASISSRRTSKDIKGWLRRLRSITCMVDRQEEGDNEGEEGLGHMSGCRLQKVKVRQSKKHMKELSALYMRQDIQAHEGAILTMKFSPDGQYLASGGEDGVVRCWQVVEEDRCNEVDIPEIDPSCIYFTVNNLSELTPLFMDKEKLSKLKSLRKTSDSACVVFPPKIFRLLEKPLHEFRGHRGEVLDLSWSNNNYLLSSSVDQTVRLWQVNHDECLKVFSHSNYVTCIQFNPVDDNYFISGSIDGKVRIWAIPDCHVVDWIDIKDIVTAVCYRPDGQGGIIGSLAGNCRFYNVSENRLQLDSQLCLIGKKKFPGKGITGFQFHPHDSRKAMVSCADSQVRILDGPNVIGKYKSLSTGSPMCASFTSDGKHILSACEDSNVYVWNVSQEESNPMKTKKITSCERFFSNASVAVPWQGMKYQNIENERQLDVLNKGSSQVIHINPPASFSLSQEFFLESFPKGSATWPEENLPVSSPKAKTSMIQKSDYKFLKSSCKSTSSGHAWGMVIVTAGWDGRIKSFHNYGLPIPT